MSRVRKSARARSSAVTSHKTLRKLAAGEELRAHMLAHGINPVEEVVFDGRLRNVDCVGDARNSKKGWYWAPPTVDMPLMGTTVRTSTSAGLRKGVSP